MTIEPLIDINGNSTELEASLIAMRTALNAIGESDMSIRSGSPTQATAFNTWQSNLAPVLATLENALSLNTNVNDSANIIKVALVNTNDTAKAMINISQSISDYYNASVEQLTIFGNDASTNVRAG